MRCIVIKFFFTCIGSVSILESSLQTIESWHGGNQQRINQKQPAEKSCWFGEFIRYTQILYQLVYIYVFLS